MQLAADMFSSVIALDVLGLRGCLINEEALLQYWKFYVSSRRRHDEAI